METVCAEQNDRNPKTKNWRHCPGIQNPADIPSRGLSAAEVQCKMDMWLHGPPCVEFSARLENPVLENFPRECLVEMKVKDRNEVTLNVVSSNIPAILSCEDYSNLQILLRV